MSFRDPFSRHFAGYNDDILTSANAHVVIFLYLHFPQEASFQEGKVRDGNFYAETSAPAPGNLPGWEELWAGRCPGCEGQWLAGHRGVASRGQTQSRSPLIPAVRLHQAARKKRGTRIILGYRVTAEPTSLQTSPASV